MSNKPPIDVTFASRISVEQVEESDQLAPKFDDNGCIPCVTVHAETKDILMFAFMNSEALKLSISTGLAHYWSVPVKSFGKGRNIRDVSKYKRILIDDDQDCVVIEVTLTPPSTGGKEASCHVGYRSCFYRAIPVKPDTADVKLEFVEEDKSFDPDKVYQGIPNPTRL